MGFKVYGLNKKNKMHTYQAVSLVVAGVVLWTSFLGAQTHLIIATAIIGINALIELMG